jgi:threonine efflux protein
VFSSLLTIAVLHWAVLLIPGFNFVLIGQLAAGGTRRAAVAAVVGMTTATLMWASFAVAGVGAVFSTHPTLRQTVQIAGGIYLLYLAFQLYRAGGAAQSSVSQDISPRAAFRAGFVTSALNPKIALFYGSVFATALPAQPSLWHVLAAVTLVYVNSWLWHGALAFALSQPKVQSAYLRNFSLLTKCSALLVGGFGARLLIAAIRELRAHA